MCVVKVVITKASQTCMYSLLDVIQTCMYSMFRYDSIFRPWLWLKFGWVGGKRFFLKRLSFTLPNSVFPAPFVLESLALSLRSRATEMNLSRDRCRPSAFKKRSVRVMVVSCVVVFFTPWRRLYAYHKVAGSCTSPVLIWI